MPYGGGYKYLSSKNSRLNRRNFIKNSKKGAILIEFAFAVPVLFSLIYYLHDLSRLKQYNERMDFVAHQMAQIIQTISQNRTDKQITINDLINTWKSAYLTVFPGNTVRPKTTYMYPLGYLVFFTIFYVKGVDNNKASVIWAASLAGDGGNSVTSELRNGSWYTKSFNNYKEISRMITKFSKDVTPSQINSNLKIEKDEIKIIVECSLLYCISRHFADGRSCADVSFREDFGFYMLSPGYKAYQPDYRYFSFFNSAVIFTPKPGLFSETPPK